MYDLSKKFNSFYNNEVVLSREEQSKLYDKAELNIKRLKDGLKIYNNNNYTSYKIVETDVQGSVAMSTVVQNDDKDYDIDVAIVFDYEDIQDIGPLALRNVVKKALDFKTTQFSKSPEVKTSCVRVSYTEGYHIDFAIFRRKFDCFTNSYIYEHAGSEWSRRDIKALADWFKKENDDSKGKLRKVVRLSKMFCKSRDSWKNMPSGLLQTVLCSEKLTYDYERIDETFYYTMVGIVDRIDLCQNVNAPIDNGRDLTSRKVDIKRVKNWGKRLRSKLEDLDILFKDYCTEEDAIQAWYGFFNHEYWTELSRSIDESFSICQKFYDIKKFNDSEQFIDDMFEMDIKYKCTIYCELEGNGFRRGNIDYYLPHLQRILPHNLKIYCTMVNTNCPGNYDIYWKVKNVGPSAQRRDMLRGQIYKKGKYIEERTSFRGNHYIECYIVQDNICVAKSRINIPIK